MSTGSPIAINSSAEVERRSLGDGLSWVDVRSSFVLEAEALLQEVMDLVSWRQNEVLRYDRYIPERRMAGSFRREAMPAAVRQTGLFLRSRYGNVMDGPAALLYRDGNDFQGLHSDRGMKWLDDTLVALLVLGTPRPLVFRERTVPAADRDRRPAGTVPGDVTLLPGKGDLVVMGGRCQRDWLHGVPAADVDGPRLSIMWRWTSRNGEPDTLPSYFDGRQFSDRPRQTGYRSARSPR